MSVGHSFVSDILVAFWRRSNNPKMVFHPSKNFCYLHINSGAFTAFFGNSLRRPPIVRYFLLLSQNLQNCS